MSSENKQRLESFTIFETYHNALKKFIPLNDNSEGRFAKYGHLMYVLCEFVLYGIKPDVSTFGQMENMAWLLISKTAEKSRLNALKGRKGGENGFGVSRNKGNNNPRKQTREAYSAKTAEGGTALTPEQGEKVGYLDMVQKDSEYITTLCQNLKVSGKSILGWLKIFDTESKAKGNAHDGGADDYKAHFYDWARKHYEHLSTSAKADEKAAYEKEALQREENMNKAIWGKCLDFMSKGLPGEDVAVLRQLSFSSYDNRNKMLFLSVSDEVVKILETDRFLPILRDGIKKYYPKGTRLNYELRR